MRWSGVILVALVAGGCASAPSHPPLEVGLGQVAITPPVGYRLAGYFYERLSTGVHDPLFARAIVFRQGDERFALVECDLCQTSADVVARARAMAESRTGIPADHIAICSTHTHTGPDYFGALAEHLHRIALHDHAGVDPARTVDYPTMLGDRIVQAIIVASASVQPAELAAGDTAQPNVAFNRRYVMTDGTVAWNPGKLNPKIARPAGPIDPRVDILRVTRSGGATAAVLTRFPLHPDTAGGTEYSADFPHYIEETVRSRLGTNVASIFAQGTSGNVNHVDVSNDSPQKGPDESARIGRLLGNAVCDALPTLSRVTRPTLAIATKTVHLPLQHFSSDEIAKARQAFEKIQERKLPFLVGVRATKIMRIEERHGGPIAAQVQAVRLGDDTAIVLLPSELFVEFGLAIKARSPFPHTIVIELANDSFGYVPTRKAFDEGAYEPTNATIEPGGGERLVEAAVGLLGRLKEMR